MLTDTDFKRIQKLFAPVATKKEIANVQADLLDVNADVAVLRSDVRELRGEMQGLRETVQAMAVSIDGLVKVIQDLREEYAAIKTQLDRHEQWIKLIATKTGVVLRV